MARKVIITCAVTGSADTVARNPAVPVTPDEIAQSALDAARAGAAIVHVHVRDPESGKASMELDHYRETAGRIRQSETDVVLNLTTGYGARLSPGVEDPFDYGPGTTFTAPARRIAHVGELRPEICSLDVATMNSGGVRDDSVMINSPPQLRYMADSMREWGVVPELEVFDVGGVRLAANLIEKGHVPEPGFFQLCLGIEWGAPATPEALSYMKSLLPEGAHWAAFGISRDQLPIAGLSVLSGGHVRTGLEDNLYLERGTLAPSNAALVEQAVSLVRMLGAEPATPAEAREILGTSN
ncbi:MAG: 3-keto-5-aminohexanoate cleavage protein [Rhodospirillaceae bacterium]|nr:3-keto-5-aminohexanoate cleavage protein [Rhodospirillaceae bacterium]